MLGVAKPIPCSLKSGNESSDHVSPASSVLRMNIGPANRSSETYPMDEGGNEIFQPHSPRPVPTYRCRHVTPPSVACKTTERLPFGNTPTLPTSNPSARFLKKPSTNPV